MDKIYLSIGANIGDKKNNIRKALNMIAEFATLRACSQPYKTEPYGSNTMQPRFINLVIKIETELLPLQLLKTCQAVENKLGRVRKEYWGERTMDIDILFYNTQIVDISYDNIPILTIPHPDLQNRYFVLRPMMDIAANFVHPVLNKSIESLYNVLLKR